MRLSDLSPELLQSFFSKLHDDPDKSVSTVRNIGKILKTALNRAVSLRIIPYNPMDGVRLPSAKSVRERGLNVWNESQVQSYTSAIDSLQMRNGAVLKVAVGTGLRMGELMALTWEDIDLDGATISVDKQVPVKKDGPYHVTPPKTDSSIRKIVVGANILDTLREQYDRTFVEARYFDWPENRFVFPSFEGGTLGRTTLRNLHFKAIKAAGLPKIRFHDLRHTAISLMLSAGVPVIEVSRYAGHGSVTTTLDVYGHFIESDRSRAAEVMQDVLTPIRLDLD
jgi:integrase